MNFDNINYPAPKQEYKVLVRCSTFNQSKYIKDALNGFAMQQTDFPFVCLVMDDASTDREQEVIKKWMESECNMSKAETIDIPTSVVIIVPHKTNAFCTFTFYLLKQNLYGTDDRKMNHVYPWREKCEYEALCEGDDYWTDSNKLQRQVDFLESNPDYSMCFHSAFLKKEIKDNYNLDFSNIEDRDYSADELLAKWIVPTASMLYKLEICNYHLNDRSKFLNGDILLVLQSAFYGRIRGMSDVMSVYRVHSGGVTYNKNIKIDRLKKYPSHYIAIKKNFPFVKRNIINKLISKSFIERATTQNTNIQKIADVLAALKYAPITTIRIIIKEYLKKL